MPCSRHYLTRDVPYQMSSCLASRISLTIARLLDRCKVRSTGSPSGAVLSCSLKSQPGFQHRPTLHVLASLVTLTVQIHPKPLQRHWHAL